MSSPGGHWPIVCFFAKRWISMSIMYCSFANLFRLVVDPKS